MAQSYWFKRRRYGWGWTPVTWQGWLVLSIYLVALIALVVWFVRLGSTATTAQIVYYFVGIIFITGLLIAIAVIKGPRARWRWGKRPNDSNDDF